MTREFAISFEPIDGRFDDPIEQATFARLSINLGERMLTRCTSSTTGIRDYIKLPLHRLAFGLAAHWWTLLYEPEPSERETSKRAALHRLDAFASGYVFPKLGLWSAGSEALTVETGNVERLSDGPVRELMTEEREIAGRLGWNSPVDPRALSRAEFTDESEARITVGRDALESQLFDLVAAVVERVGGTSYPDHALLERWTRVVASMNDSAERNYCVAAGRLGFDPYDPDTPDFTVFATQLPEESFDDLCEAARFDELSAASPWVALGQHELDQAPAIDLAQFGTRPALDPTRPAWQSGYGAAIELRHRLQLNEKPLEAGRRLIGETTGGIIGDGPAPVEGLLVREGDRIRSLVRGQSNAQQRFRKCRAAYLGWVAEPDTYPLVTTAATHRQKASRAFAAEILCPADYLRGRAGRYGLTSDEVDEIAGELDCQYAVVERQAQNHGIPLRGFN